MKRTLKWGFFRKAAEVQRTLAFFVPVRNLRIIYNHPDTITAEQPTPSRRNQHVTDYLIAEEYLLTILSFPLNVLRRNRPFSNRNIHPYRRNHDVVPAVSAYQNACWRESVH